MFSVSDKYTLILARVLNDRRDDLMKPITTHMHSKDTKMVVLGEEEKVVSASVSSDMEKRTSNTLQKTHFDCLGKFCGN